MGDLVQVDFDNNEHDDSYLRPADEPPSSETSDRVYRKKLEEHVYKRTLKRLRREFRKSENHKKEKLYIAAKRLFDIAASGSGIAVLSPFLAVLCILIYSSDGGQPIYSQVRLGKNGKKLRIYKFRSMRTDSEDMEKLLSPKQLKQFLTEYKIDNDPRITKIGRFIRKTSIDELPQLFNVLDGDMSLIGPRPIVEEEAANYSKKQLKKLLSVKPGLTGYWQAFARNKATYSDGLRQSLELYYTDHRSIGFDIKVFAKTIISVLKQEGAQ